MAGSVKRAIGGLVLTGLAAGFAVPAGAQTAGASEQQNWQATISNETRFMNWASTYGHPAPVFGTSKSKGWQVYSSSGFQLVGRLNDDTKLSLLLRSGAISAHQSSAGLSNSYAGFTDTTVGATLTYYGIDGIQPFVAIQVNLPTGSGSSSGYASKMDSDISKIPNYGEGYNVGATAGLTIPISRALVAALSAGFTHRGPYMSDGALGSLSAQSLNPGEVFTLTSSLTYKQGPLNAQLSAVYTSETKARMAGLDYFRSGDKVQLTASAGYRWSDAWSSKVSASWSHLQRNQVFVTPPPALNLEPFNSNGDVLSLDVSTSYRIGALSLTPSVGLLHRTKNSYDPVNLAFVPAKTTTSVGLGAAYAVTDRASLTASVGHTWALENPRLTPTTPRLHTRVLMTSIGGSIKF